jgi:hypothetical protein
MALSINASSAALDADVAGDKFAGVFELGVGGCRHGGAWVHQKQRAYAFGASRGPGGVAGLVHQRVQLGRVGQLDLEEPAGTHRVAIGQRGVGAQGFVDFGDLTGHGHVHVGGGLDGFDHTGHVFGGKGLAHFGQVDKHHVAQRVLRMVGDAHGGDVAVNAQPFVVGGVLDGHEKLLKKLKN